MSNINKRWFVDQLAARGESQAALARFLDVHPSQMSLIINGKRRLQMSTAERIANFLQLPVEEVLENAGIRLTKPKGGEVSIRLVGTVDDTMTVRPSPRGDESCIASGVPAGAVAVRARTAGTRADWMDGWLFFFEPQSGIDPSLVSEFCVAEDVNGVRRIGTLRRGYAAGTHNIVTPGGVIEDLNIKSATRVLQIRP